MDFKRPDAARAVAQGIPISPRNVFFPAPSVIPTAQTIPDIQAAQPVFTDPCYIHSNNSYLITTPDQSIMSPPQYQLPNFDMYYQCQPIGHEQENLKNMQTYADHRNFLSPPFITRLEIR